MSKIFGIILFYLTWPILYFITQKTTRVRVKIIHENRILLVKNWYGPGEWQLPGGGIKPGETALVAASREIKEELSMVIPSDVRIISKSTINFKVKGLNFNYIIAEVNITEEPLIKKSLELSDYKWFDFSSNQIPDYAKDIDQD